MKIDCWFPNPIKLIECELNTLRFIRSRIIGRGKFGKLVADADAYLPKYINLIKSKKLQSFCFKFESCVDIKVDRRDGGAYIGAKINMKDRQALGDISYYLAVAENKKLLRKFHFDYEPTTQIDSSLKQDHPVFHLQYGGKPSKELQENIECEHIDSWLSEPRISYSPMSLALLINLVLKEFPDEKNKKIIEKNEWRSMIRKNEDLILKPFYERCNGFFSNRDKNNLFTNDFYYGN